MDNKPRRRRGYIYRTHRKISFLLRRGSLFRTPGKKTGRSRRNNHAVYNRSFIPISLNSLFLFLLAYVLVSLIYSLSTALAAIAFNIPTTVYLNEISFLIKGVGWTPDAVKIVYCAGPLVCLLAGAILIILYNITAEETGMLRLLVLWMFAHSMVFFFGEIMMGSLFNRDFGYVLMYLYAQDTVMMVVTVLALIGMISVGFSVARYFTISANIYFNELPAFYTRKFLGFQFLVPFLAGNFIIWLIKLPSLSLYDITLNLTMIFMLIPVMIRGKQLEDFYFDEDQRSIRLSYPIILVSIVVLILFRIMLAPGLKLFC